MHTCQWDLHHLDLQGQLPGLRIYTQISLCYSLPSPTAQSQRSAIIATLTNGLERLSAALPWTSGQVVDAYDEELKDTVAVIRPLSASPKLVVKDLSTDPTAPSFASLRRENFPFRLLDESLCAPRRTIPGDPSESLEAEDDRHGHADPVLIVQATFLDGGLVLTVVGAHCAMDMTGQGVLINMLDKACRGEPFAEDEMKWAAVDRRTLVPLLRTQDLDIAHLEQQPVSGIPSENTPPSPSSAPPPKCRWGYISFSSSSLSAIKSLATSTLPADFEGFISTDDALTAFIWQCIVRARLPRLAPSPTPTTLGRAVDVRPWFPATGPAYPGLLQLMAYTTFPSVHEFATTDTLGLVASNLRKALHPTKPDNLGHQTQALAALLASSPEKRSGVNFGATLNLQGGDMMISSWSKMGFYGLDFGMGLGAPVAVRRPQFVPFESLIYFMPKRADGEVSVGLCLREEDWERLITDEEFSKFGTYIP